MTLSSARGRRSFNSHINRIAEPRKSRASGMVTGVTTDAGGLLSKANVLVNGANISVQVPFGMSVYEGMTVSLTNGGTPSNARWQIAGTAAPSGITGGTITNPSGAITALFDNIWVRNDGYVMIGGDIDLNGNPAGPRIVGTSCGWKGYDEYEQVSMAMYTSHCDGRNPGDQIFGRETGAHVEVLPEDEQVAMYGVNQTPVFLFSSSGNMIRDPLTIGDPVGARINIGEIDDKATIVLRNRYGVAKLVARTNDNGAAYFHVGNPPPQANSFYFDEEEGELVVNGKLIAQSGRFIGRMEFASTGSFMIVDPDDPQRYGVITPRGIYAYSVDNLGQQYVSSVDAWGPLTVTSRGVTKTWLAGEFARGDVNYRHFRAERGPTGRAGLFNGDDPIVYADYTGTGWFSGTVISTDGNIGNWIINQTSLTAPSGYVALDTNRGVVFIGAGEDPGESLEAASEDVHSYMLTFWESGTGDSWPTHRMLAYNNSNTTPDTRVLSIQSQPLSDYRSLLRLSAFSEQEAKTNIRAVGGYDTASQETTQIDLWAYRAEHNGSSFEYRRIDFDTDAICLFATDVSAFDGTIRNGTIAYVDGSGVELGAGEGLYWYVDGVWKPIRLAAAGWSALTAGTHTAGNEQLIHCNASGGAITLNLPAATAKPLDWQYSIIKSDSTGNTVTIDADGSATINGATTKVLSAQYETVTIRRYGANWLIIN